MRLPHRRSHRTPVHRGAGQGRNPAALHGRVGQRPDEVGTVTMTDDDKTPAREVITDYAQAHFRYFRTADGTVYAQRNGHPVARPIRSQGTTGSHRQVLMVGLYRDGLGVFNGTALKEALDLIEALALTEDVRQVHIRVAPGFDGATWLDLGRADGRSVRIHPSGWDVTVPDPREVCWRRT